MKSKLYVGNMSFKTTEAELRGAFGRFGTVTDVSIPNENETGPSRGVAFVTFSTDVEAKLALENLNGFNLSGRFLTVNLARPMEEPTLRHSFNNPIRRLDTFPVVVERS